jgi:hypothetical protein
MHAEFDKWVAILVKDPTLNFLRCPKPKLPDQECSFVCCHSYSSPIVFLGGYHNAASGQYRSHKKHRVEGERDDQEPKKTDFWGFVPGE